MITSLLTDLRDCLPEKPEEGFANTVYNWSKPSSWPELRHITPQGAIALLICDKYPYFACQADCQGGYTAILDGAQYATYASGEKCSFALAEIEQSGTLTDYPEPLTIHTLLIVPAQTRQNISAFKTALYDEESTEAQGVLWAHFNLRQAISLANCFYAQNLTQPLLEAITSAGDVLKVTSAEYAFAQTPVLRYLPQLQGETLSANAFKGTCLNSTTLKQLRFGGAQGGASAESLAEGCLALEELKTKSPLSAPTDISKMFKNCQNLRRLPQLDYTNTLKADCFLENCTSLQDTALDFSAAESLKKLSTGATEQKPLNSVKSVLVSKKAPFDAASPQIDISHTGLNRSALVNLFESLPYNAGYITGADAQISNNVYTRTLTSHQTDYVHSNIGFYPGDKNIKMEFFVGANSLTFPVFQVLNTRCFARINNNNIRWVTGADDTKYIELGTSIFNYTSYLAAGIYIRYTREKDGNTFIHTLAVSPDKNNWYFSRSEDTENNYTGGVLSLLYYLGGTTTGSFVDLSKSSIEIDGIPWIFWNMPAASKNCNITGCAGTENLSAADKALATAKGWELMQ